MVDKILYIDARPTGPYYFKHGLYGLAGIIEVDGEERGRFDVSFKPHERAKIDADFVKERAGRAEAVKEAAGIIKSGQDMRMAFTNILPLIEKYTEDIEPAAPLHVAGWEYLEFFPAFFKQGKIKDYKKMFWPEMLDVKTLTANAFREYRHLWGAEFNPATIAPALGIDLDPLSTNVDLIRDIFKIVSNNKPKIIAP